MVYKLKFFLKNKIPWLYTFALHLYQKINKQRFSEKNKKLGTKNKGKKIYIIRIRRETLGLMGYYMAVLGHLNIAESKGAIPVIDMKNYKNTYLEEEKIGKENAWEYYFFQPTTEVSLDDAYNSYYAILSNLETPFEANPRWFYERVICENKLNKYFNLIKEYIKYQPEVEEILIKNYNELLKPILDKKNKILGIVCRGTDIINFQGHSIQPSLEQSLKYVKILMDKYKCNYLFIASDSNKAIEYFRENLGDKTVIVNESVRYDEFNNKKVNVLSEMKFDRENDKYLRGIEYLTTMYLLSKCNVLFGSLVGSTIGAICMNNGEYEHIEIFDEGVYK